MRKRVLVLAALSLLPTMAFAAPSRPTAPAMPTAGGDRVRSVRCLRVLGQRLSKDEDELHRDGARQLSQRERPRPFHRRDRRQAEPDRAHARVHA